ncbi:MAG: alpha-amylase, partial [Anaerolineae bacterium]|nr:alpha-amylase [Anaerolineae bacterium]
MAHFNGAPWEETLYSHPSGLTVFSYRVGHDTPPEWARDTLMYHLVVDRFYPGDGRGWHQTTDPGQPMGGTLDGVADKIGYLADLGIDSLWLSPVFESPSYHGYNVTDYYRVADRLGGGAALRRLVDEAHRRGIRVILDLVCNHVSDQHPLFVNARGSRSSPYRDWFYFRDDLPHGYLTFFDVAAMPEINLGHPGARAMMLDV